MSVDIVNAVYFAAEKHTGQFRKDEKTPYINHPIGVAKILINANITDSNTLQAALLHDVLEDTKCTYEELVKKFGLEVANLVRELTDDTSLDTNTKKLIQIEHILTMSLTAVNIKLADRIYNLQDMNKTEWSLEKKKLYCAFGYGIYMNCKSGVNMHLRTWLLNEIEKYITKEECLELLEQQRNKQKI